MQTNMLRSLLPLLVVALATAAIVRAQGTPPTPPAPSSSCKVWEVSRKTFTVQSDRPDAFIGAGNDGWEPFSTYQMGVGAVASGIVVFYRKCAKA
jgi:hypothetical protein